MSNIFPISETASASNYYYAYGLKLKSALELPELVSYDGTDFDVEIKLENLARSPLTNLESYWFCCDLNPEGLWLYWQGIGTMLVSQGKKISLQPIKDVDIARMRLFILGAALGAILHQREYIVLHASAVAIDASAVVFTAPKGEGKSTMTGTLYARGHQFIADDVVAIDFSNPQRPMVFPAFPQLKLWPDSATQIGRDPDSLPKLIDRLEKREYLFEDFSLKPVPLKQIFVLGTDSAIAIKPFKPQEMILMLLKNLYVSRFGSTLLSPQDPKYFFQLTDLAKQVGVAKLLRPRSLTMVVEVAEAVEEYLEYLTAE